jgi:branched-subunit amino acid aminotransferase/4-amino-4-deoxychorismate lyase
VEEATTAATLDALSQELPRGTYTTFRTYGRTKALHLRDHLDRLTESAALEGHTLALDQRAVRQAIMQAIDRCGFPESRVRITLCYDPPGRVFIALEEFIDQPSGRYQRGVQCATAPAGLRRQNPRSKATSFISPGSRARATSGNVNEVLLVGADGAVLEGSSSNFFAVIGGTLRTADEGVLAGITRGMVLDQARGLLPIMLQPINLADIPRLDEAFITSVSRAVLPVVAIDGRPIGKGVPGPITQEIGRRFNISIQQQLEPIAGR